MDDIIALKMSLVFTEEGIEIVQSEAFVNEQEKREVLKLIELSDTIITCFDKIAKNKLRIN